MRDIVMPMVTVKQKYQVTIPAKIRRDMGLHEGDALEAVARGGRIILTPKVLVDRKYRNKKPSLLSLRGTNKGSGLYKNADHADDYIAKQRTEWK
ncbi:MAG: AbrB family looped-hinge helix DNA binding protein [Gammaproteobacteria bacterium]|jgi:AbrB family looped-hinge helix DNA binding protein